MKNLKNLSYAYALKNALAYEGQANQGAIISGLFNEGLKKSEVKNYVKVISEILKKVNSMSLEEQKKEFEKLKELVGKRHERVGLPELPNAKKSGVVMRFAPSPSGAMHIGHALTASISYLYVKKYGGEFYVRIEDTNPDNIYPPSYELLKKDSKWLFEGNAKIVIQSERIKIYYKYVEKLINKKAVYVCTCPSEEFKKFVEKKKECPCRILGVSENKKRWERMLDKNGFKEGKAVLRFKADMQDKNPAMRDFPLARINENFHSLQKKKYRVWPLMNLAVTVDDIEMKMTHIIRAKEHRDNAKRQKMIFDILKKEFPWTGFLGRIKFKDLELSATKITNAIEEGKYSGWDDEKLPTLASLMKRGYKPESFYKFAERIGLNENDKVMDKKEFFLLLDEFNRVSK